MDTDPDLAGAELRAAADRLVHSVAYLNYLASVLKAKEADRTVRATGITVRATFGHIVQWLESQAERCAAFASGAASLAQMEEVDELNRRFAVEASDTPLPDLLARLRIARDSLLTSFRALSAEQASASVRGGTIAAALLAWTAHPQRHALDFAEALPRLRFDPLLLDWALNAQLDERSELERQLKLARAAAAHLRSSEEAPDDS